MLGQLEPAQLWASASVVVVIVALVVFFFVQFCLPAARTVRSLKKTQRLVSEASQLIDFRSSANSRLDTAFNNSRERAAWIAYSLTLVPETNIGEDGLDVTTSWHTGTPASTFFTASSLVEVPLTTEFFKHLPGILTGFGIIGTFIGIITGLYGVDLGADQTQTLHFLNKLMHSVAIAFGVSAIAIFSATCVTIVEKFLFAKAIGGLSELENLLDQLFNKDLTDTNLERLVSASERSATQTAQLKDSLITDLKELLDELGTRNADSLAIQTENLSKSITESIRTSLDEPIGRITEAVNNISSSQGDAVNRLMTDMIASFTQRFEDVAGKQNAELSRMLSETTQIMQNVSADFAGLSDSLRDAGRGAVDAMGEELSALLKKVSDSQQSTSNALDAFLETLSSRMADSQTDLSKQQAAAIEQLSAAATELIARMQNQGQALADEQRRQHTAFSDQVSTLTGSLSTAISELMERTMRATVALEENVSSLTKTTTKAIDGIETGASKLQDATLALAMAGDGLAKSLRDAANLSSNIESTAHQLTQASSTLDRSISANQGFAATTSQIASELKQIVETARREAGVTSQLVAGIEGAASKISEASREAEAFLQQIGGVLAVSQAEFTNNVQGTLKSVSQEFHKNLSEAVGLLSGSITDLRTYLDELANSLTRSGN